MRYVLEEMTYQVLWESVIDTVWPIRNFTSLSNSSSLADCSRRALRLPPVVVIVLVLFVIVVLYMCVCLGVLGLLWGFCWVVFLAVFHLVARPRRTY